MCIFSAAISKVSKTRIFARHTDDGIQGLIYQLDISTPKQVAMILPIPVALPAEEDSLVFHDLSDCERLFSSLDLAFPKLVPAVRKSGVKKPTAKKAAAFFPKLIVHSVGSFEASFVPSIEDFDRLDPRFRLSKNTWKSLPQYKDYGFAVFQLKSAKGSYTPHPMAFEFATRDSERLFFPTVHIHNGKVTKRASFDHTLYFQGPESMYRKGFNPRMGMDQFTVQGSVVLKGIRASDAATGYSRRGWAKFSGRDITAFIKQPSALALIAPWAGHRMELSGERANVDHWASFVPKKRSS